MKALPRISARIHRPHALRRAAAAVQNCFASCGGVYESAAQRISARIHRPTLCGEPLPPCRTVLRHAAAFMKALRKGFPRAFIALTLCGEPLPPCRTVSRHAAAFMKALQRISARIHRPHALRRTAAAVQRCFARSTPTFCRGAGARCALERRLILNSGG